jgi:hypothetical protein
MYKNEATAKELAIVVIKDKLNTIPMMSRIT